LSEELERRFDVKNAGTAKQGGLRRRENEEMGGIFLVKTR